MGRLLNFLLTKNVDEQEGGEAGGGTTTGDIAIYTPKIQLARRWPRRRTKTKKVKDNETR